jgi:hypothetical protein
VWNDSWPGRTTGHATRSRRASVAVTVATPAVEILNQVLASRRPSRAACPAHCVSAASEAPALPWPWT